MNIADRIKGLRASHRYTQKDLAKLLNVKSTTVSGWELGRNEPSIDTLKKLADIFNVSFEYIAGVKNNPEREIPNDKDLDEMLDNARSFDGKPMNSYDREIIRSYLKGYYQNKNK